MSEACPRCGEDWDDCWCETNEKEQGPVSTVWEMTESRAAAMNAIEQGQTIGNAESRSAWAELAKACAAVYAADVERYNGRV